MRPVDKPEFWKPRIEFALEHNFLQHSVFDSTEQLWAAMEDKHRRILGDSNIDANASVLDVGCAYGRLLDLMPNYWTGPYCGIDISPDFIELARKQRPGRMFIVGDIRTAFPHNPSFDIAVCIMVRHMIRKDLGEKVWNSIETKLNQIAKRIIILEPDGYDD